MADWKFGRLGSFSRVFLAPEGAGAGAEDGSGSEGGAVNQEILQLSAIPLAPKHSKSAPKACQSYRFSKQKEPALFKAGSCKWKEYFGS